MATTEERMTILNMVQEGKINAEEGVRLLQALQASKKKVAGRDPRWLRIRVTDLKTGQSKVNVNIPMSLVNVGIKMGARFAPESIGIDHQELMDALKAGTTGKIADFEDTAEAERVEIWSE